MVNNEEDNNILTPLFEKHIKRKRIVSFDIETHSEENKFYLGGIYSKEEGYKPFYNQDAFIKEFLKNKYYGNTYVIATNLGFDLVGTFYNKEMWNYLNIVMNSGRMIFVNITSKNLKKLTFIDSFNFAPFSVEKMGKILNLPKLKSPKALGKIPKNKEERKELEIYNKRDCEVTYYFMKLLSEGFFNAGGKLKTTIASTAMDIFRRKYLRRKIKKESAVLGFDIEPLIFRSYYGGRTEVFKRGKIGKMKMYDVNSLYPSVMIKEYPLPDSVEYKEFGSIDIIKKYEGVSEVEIFCPKMKYPLLATRFDNKLIFPTGLLKGVYTNVELRKALQLGYKIKEIRQVVYYKKTFYPFKEYVTDLYNKRKELKKQKNPNELVYKLLLNSLYGKFAQKNLTETTFFNKDFLNDKEIENINKMQEGVIMKDDHNGMIIEKKKCEESFVLPILSSYTTAYARIVIHDYIVKGEAYYCDTDSIITNKILPESTALGKMKVEHEILEGVLVRPKMYYLKTLVDKEVKEVIKLKGVPKKLIYKNNKVILNKNIFMDIMKGEKVYYDKFTKLKEAVRRGLVPNSIMKMEKYILLTDNKRLWNEAFNYKKLGDSEPLCLI